MEALSDLRNAPLFAECYAATLRSLPAPGCYQWNGPRWLPIDHYMLLHLAENILIDPVPAPCKVSCIPVKISVGLM